MMKRFLALALLSATILGSSFLLSGCTHENLVYENLFYYNFYYENNESSKNEKCVLIRGLTEEAKQLTTLIVPERIDGCPVRQVGVKIVALCFFSSEVAERVYLPSEVRSIDVSIPRSAKIICMRPDVYELHGVYSNPYFNQIDDINKNYAEVRPNKYANVAYLYNYNDAPGSGIYLLDDYDNEPILYPPENVPVRDGYTFAGWYKEKECITPWEFATDIIPQKEFYDYDVVVGGDKRVGEKQKLLVTQLFAKWEKID